MDLEHLFNENLVVGLREQVEEDKEDGQGDSGIDGHEEGSDKEYTENIPVRITRRKIA